MTEHITTSLDGSRDEIRVDDGYSSRVNPDLARIVDPNLEDYGCQPGEDPMLTLDDVEALSFTEGAPELLHDILTLLPVMAEGAPRPNEPGLIDGPYHRGHAGGAEYAYDAPIELVDALHAIIDRTSALPLYPTGISAQGERVPTRRDVTAVALTMAHVSPEHLESAAGYFCAGNTQFAWSTDVDMDTQTWLQDNIDTLREILRTPVTLFIMNELKRSLILHGDSYDEVCESEILPTLMDKKIGIMLKNCMGYASGEEWRKFIKGQVLVEPLVEKSKVIKETMAKFTVESQRGDTTVEISIVPISEAMSWYDLLDEDIRTYAPEDTDITRPTP